MAALMASACAEVESAAVDGYQPAKVEHNGDVVTVILTEEGAERTGVETSQIESVGGQLVAPYAALLYDPAGRTYVYTSPEPLSFERAEVVVDRIEGDRVYLTDGPAAGTAVVTTGAAEVYGVELEVDGSH
jgi:hypothetical protein